MVVDLTLPLGGTGAGLTVGDEAENHRLIASGHVGTHLDSYEGTTIPLEYFKSRGVMFKVRGAAGRDIEPADIDLDALRAGDFVLFDTGWMEQHAYGTREYAAEHPQLSSTLLDALLGKKPHFIGLDAPGIRRHSQHRPADVLCEQNGAYVIENLTGLSVLPPAGFTVYTLWLKMPGASGLPCRVLAEF